MTAALREIVKGPVCVGVSVIDAVSPIALGNDGLDVQLVAVSQDPPPTTFHVPFVAKSVVDCVRYKIPQEIVTDFKLSFFLTCKLLQKKLNPPMKGGYFSS
jgi:hypothetical protein